MRGYLGTRYGVLTILLSATASVGQFDLLWMNEFGTSAGDRAYGLASDGAGGVFVAGGTDGDLGGPNAGLTDIYIARYDGAGQRTWITQFGTTSTDRVYSLAPDGAGGVFGAGLTTGDLGGPNAGDIDAILTRYDGAGNRIWLVQFGSVDDDRAYQVAPDGAGGAFVSGFTRGDLGGPKVGMVDMFLARYDGAGNQVWIVHLGTKENDSSDALLPDGVGGVYLSGSTYGSLGGPNAGHYDDFLARYDEGGKQVWITQYGTSQDEHAGGLAPDGAGGLFMSGFTWGDLGGAQIGLGDVYLAHFTEDGHQSWTTQFGTSQGDWGVALAPDAEGGVFLCGGTNGSLGAPNQGEADIFLAHHDSAGNQAGVTQFGTYYDDRSTALSPIGAGGVFMTGYTLGGPNHGNYDAFVARFADGCYADCDGSGGLDLFDFLCFVNLFNEGDDASDCNGNGALDLFDFLCFVNTFNAGC